MARPATPKKALKILNSAKVAHSQKINTSHKNKIAAKSKTRNAFDMLDSLSQKAQQIVN